MALAAVIGAGFLFSGPLAPAIATVPREPIVAGVLFFMALPLDIRAMWRALRHPLPVLVAVTINFVLVPLLAVLVREANVLPGELAMGLIVMSTIPCTLASAAVWTRRAGGNDAVAIVVMVLTNLACFVVTPAWLAVLADTDVSNQFDFGKIVLRLGLLVVLPILLAQLLRSSPLIASWATDRKTAFGVISQCGILSLVLAGAVNSGRQLATNSATLQIQPLDWFSMLAAVVAVHVVALWFGHAASRLLGFGRPERIAVGFSGSQKTLAVGLDIGLEFFGGLSILPMVAFHVCQLLVDTVVADRLKAQGESKTGAEGLVASAEEH